MNRTRILLVALILLVVPVLAFGQSSTTGNQRVIPTYQVTITSNVRNAEVYLNGELQRGTTPATLNLRRGTYEIRVESRGYLPWVETVSVTSNTTIRAELLPPFATVVLEIPREFQNDDIRNPLGLIDFYIDGQLRREAQIQVRSGRHEVAIVSGGLKFEGQVVLEAGMTYTLELILRLNLLQNTQAGGR
ncbi:MAG: PEGA domain-containing protein [Spirochaetales bacterium]|nr:PEGA domain-containing protein [Spirochaetales bacterium]